MDNKNREATSYWMAKKLLIVMRTHPHLSRKGIEAEMLKYGVHSNKQQVYRARQKAREEIEDTYVESYSKLPKYVVLLRQHNPGSICKIHYDRPNLLVEPKFLRLFISFKGQKDGFLVGCRAFVGFDGCHLKGSFGRVLLTAVALDANNSIFPIAFAIAKVENKETWSWFFHFFEEFFGPFHNNISLTFMSDRQKGLNLAYEQLLPSVTGRYCYRHICSNFKAQFPGMLLTSFFWQAAKSYDAIGFNEAMQSIKDMNIEAWRYLSKILVSAWARHAFSTEMKCDHVTNNFIESFNAWIGDLRGQPILTLAEGLRKKFMKNLHKRYQKTCTWTSAIPKIIISKLKEIAQTSRRCSLQMASEDLFEVSDGDRAFIVSLNQKTCDCGAFQLLGLPCKHAALGIIYRRQKLETYCDPCFSTEMYLKTYSGMVTQNRAKPGRGIANTWLEGFVLWDHVDGNVPIVVSSQGSNPSPSSQSTAINAELNLQTTTNATKRKRERPSNKSAPSTAHNSNKKTSKAALQPIAIQPIATLHPSGSAQVQTVVNINDSATHDSHNVSSSFTF
ncbi:uncharacterized protein [Coffea arabica]|uniref:SWIM-type domain-containing protein n=1 Tax=Coffea arabica TaxID=13443 RepID=A0A6P6SAR2_COFAR